MEATVVNAKILDKVATADTNLNDPVFASIRDPVLHFLRYFGTSLQYRPIMLVE